MFRALSLSVLLALASPGCGQRDGDGDAAREARTSPEQRLPALRELTFTTEAYRAEALELLLREANRVARELGLAEKLPITAEDLVETFITPPRMALGMKAIGNISTRSYRYYFSVGNKFSFLVRTDLEREYRQLEAEYQWPTNRIDTNSAFRIATQFLAAASMDVSALTRDCRVEILPWTPAGVSLIPLYWVRWYKGTEVLAMVEVLQPSKTLRQLHVKKSEYILRTPLELPKLDSASAVSKPPSETASGPAIP